MKSEDSLKFIHWPLSVVTLQVPTFADIDRDLTFPTDQTCLYSPRHAPELDELGAANPRVSESFGDSAKACNY